MPTDIERAYLEQGNRLPEGLSWELVAERRQSWGIDPVLVPLAVAPGCVGWGVPFVGAKPLRCCRGCGSGGEGSPDGTDCAER